KYLFLQINIFFSLFALTLEDLDKDSLNGDLKKQYFAFVAEWYTPIRYLFELFLTTAHVLKEPTFGERYRTVLSLCLSERAYQHKIDLEIHRQEDNEDTAKALINNQSEYQKFVTAFVDMSAFNLPEKIDDLKPEHSLFKSFDLKYYSHAKINYKEEYKNPLVEESLKEFRLNPEALLTMTYSLLSLDSHPTVRTLEKLDHFISWPTDQKIGSIIAAKEFNRTILRFVGRGMCNLIKPLVA
ncbi:MAG TPA: hypothetical protein VIY48_16200, partial [Candidatus Paceibacterota bacterium]